MKGGDRRVDVLAAIEKGRRRPREREEQWRELLNVLLHEGEPYTHPCQSCPPVRLADRKPEDT